MDRFEENYRRQYRNFNVHLHSSMDRFEALFDDCVAVDFEKFTFQYG